jgi:hypothetical protein
MILPGAKQAALGGPEGFVLATGFNKVKPANLVVIARSEATRQSILAWLPSDGLPRRLRLLAMTMLEETGHA